MLQLKEVRIGLLVAHGYQEEKQNENYCYTLMG